MYNSTIALLGSSRNPGNTSHLLETLLEETSTAVLDLNEMNMGYYRYEQDYAPEDDFIEWMERLVQYRIFIFATPVYWYSMSAVMKTFFDRLTDLLGDRRDLKTKLKGKTIYLVSTGGGGDLPEGFVVPFRETADYLKMKFGGHLHTAPLEEDDSAEVMEKIRDFKEKIFN